MSKPDLSHILLTNAPPNDTEVGLLERGIADMTTAILQLQDQLRHLEEERAQHRRALSVVRRVPPEILGEIFLLILYFPLDSAGRSQLVNLGRVCRAWREATLLSHRLWSSVVIQSSGPALYTFTEKLGVWFSRSGDAPRRIDIEHEERCGGIVGCCPLLHPVVLELLRTGPVIEEMRLVSKGVTCLSSMLNSLEGDRYRQDLLHRPWDSLRRLDVHFSDDVRWTVETLVSERRETIFASLPAVTSLSLRLPSSSKAFDDPFQSAKVYLDISPTLLGNLRDLSFVCDWKGAHILTALQHCRGLEVLKIDPSFQSLTFRQKERAMQHRLDNGGLVLPKLRVLRLLHQTEVEILRYLALPLLDTLDLGFNGDAERRDMAGNQPRTLKHGSMLRQFVCGRPHCQQNLTTLRIYDAAFSPEELVDVVLELPSLLHLILDKVYINSSRFLALLKSKMVESRYDANARKCLPCLTHFGFLQVEIHTPVAPSLLASIFEFLLDRGCPCELTLSFQNHKVLNESWTRSMWRLLCKRNDVDLEKLGIYLKVLRP